MATTAENFGQQASQDKIHLFTPAAVLPSQIPGPRLGVQKGEVLLLWGLLLDAMHVLTEHHPEGKQWLADVEWLRSNEIRPFSFAFVCDHLGLDKDRLRAFLEGAILACQEKPLFLRARLKVRLGKVAEGW